MCRKPSTAFRQSLRLAPDFAQAHWNLSLALLMAASMPKAGANTSGGIARETFGAAAHVDRAALARRGPGGTHAAPVHRTGYRRRAAIRALCGAARAGGSARRPAGTRRASAAARHSAGCRADGAHCRRVAPARFSAAAAFGRRRAAHGRDAASRPRCRTFRVSRENAAEVAPALGACPGNAARRPFVGRQPAASERSPPLVSARGARTAARACRTSRGFRCRRATARTRSRACPRPRASELLDARNDFARKAALVAGLDLVISVCTSNAHLAGALGKPVWVLLAYRARLALGTRPLRQPVVPDGAPLPPAGAG